VDLEADTATGRQEDDVGELQGEVGAAAGGAASPSTLARSVRPPVAVPRLTAAASSATAAAILAAPGAGGWRGVIGGYRQPRSGA
jgi:hypothetical protein